MSGSLTEKLLAVHAHPSDPIEAPDSPDSGPLNGIPTSNGDTTDTSTSAGEPQNSDSSANENVGVVLTDMIASGKLPALPRSKGPRWSKEPAEKPYSAAAIRNLEPNTTQLVELSSVDKSLVTKAIAEIRQQGVSVEASTGSTGVMTFLLKGTISAVPRAQKILYRQLTPKVKRKIDLPFSARSAIIGPRGATLKNVTDETGTRIDVGTTPHSSESWTLPHITVEIEGTHTGVQDAIEMLTALVNTPVQDQRTVPENLVLFAEKFASEQPGVTVSMRKPCTLILAGNFSELQAARTALDEYLAKCEAEFAKRPLNHRALPTDLVFAEHGVVLLDKELYGPALNLDAAAKAVDQYAKSLSFVELDLSQAYSRDLDHAANLAAYLDSSGKLKEIESAYENVWITRDTWTYTISGPDPEAVKEAKRALVAIVNQTPPPAVMVCEGVKSPLCLAQAKQVAQSIRRKKDGVLAVVEPEKILLVFDLAASKKDFLPSFEELQTILSKYAEQFAKIVEREKDQVSETVPLSKSDFKFIREPYGTAKKRLADLCVEDGIRKVDIVAGDGGVAIVSGSKADVEALVKVLPELVAESRHQAELANYTETMNFDPALLKRLIGRNGSNISKIRSEFGCRIDAASDGKIAFQGFQENVKAARKHIQNLEAQLKDFRVEELAVPHQYHAMLIGTKGRFVRHIRDKYNVHVKFPSRDATPEQSSSPSSSGDTTLLGSDVIVLRGPSKGIAATQKEFEELIAYEKAHSEVKEVRVPSLQLSRIIGRQGLFINKVKELSNATIDVAKEPNTEDDTVSIFITGSKEEVTTAANEIEQAVATILDTVDRKLEIDPKLHRFLKGRDNSIRDKIVADAGGDAGLAWYLTFPSVSSRSNIVRLSGPSKVVDAMEKQIQEILAEHVASEKFSDVAKVPAKEVRYVIGPGGAAKRAIETDEDVIIEIPRAVTTPHVEIVIKGKTAESVAAAKAQILDLVDLSEATIELPSFIEGDLFNRGALSKKLLQDFNVRVSMPKRPSQPRAVSCQGLEPPQAVDRYAFVMKPFVTKQDAEKMVTWTLSGKDDDSCERARSYVAEQVDRYKEHDTVGYLWLAQPAMYSKIIGPGGSVVNTVRSKTECQIVIPKKSDHVTTPVTIRGRSTDVEAAKQLFLEQLS